MAAVGLAALLAACGGGNGGGDSVVERIVPAPGGDVLVSRDPNPIIARNSPMIAVNPVQPTNMVVVDRIDRPDYGVGVHVTNDAGQNWQDVTLQRPAGNDAKLFAPSAVYDGRGRLYVSFATLSGAGNDPDGLWLTRSGDGGLTFDEPSRVAGPDGYQMALASDVRSGRLFAAWLQSTPEATECILCFAGTNLPIVLSRSDDGGRTWSDPVRVSDEGRARVGAPALAVDRDGNPAVLYVDFGDDRWDWENLPGNFDGTFSLVATRSLDKGGRWKPGQVVDSDVVPPGRFLVYLPVTPGFAIARNGDMFAVWGDARSGDSDVLLRRSGDGGRTWGSPVRVNRGAVGDGVPQDLPAVDVAPGGRVDVVYYDRTVDPRGPTADVVLSSSSDGGESFPENVRLSTQPSNRRIGPENTPHLREADFGSRLSVASLAGGAIAVWTDSRNGTADTGKQDVFLASVPLDDNSSLGLAFRVLAGAGILLGMAGVTLFVLSRRARRQPAPAAADDVRAERPLKRGGPPPWPPPASGPRRSLAVARGRHWGMRRLMTALAPTLLVLLAGPAVAQGTVTDAAASALRRDPVYVDPAAEQANRVSPEALRERIRSGDATVFVAVLPAAAAAETNGDREDVVTALMGKVDIRGTYAVLVGNSFVATSSSIDAGRAADLATRSFQSRRSEGPNAVLQDFIDRVNQVGTGSAPAADGGSGSESRGGGGTVLLLLALVGGGLFLWSRSRGRQRRQEERKEFEGDRQMLQAELSVLGSDVMELEPHVIMHPDARPDYDAGVTRYRSAQAALEYADDQVDLVRVERVIEEGRYAMARARARIEGRDPPAPPEALTRPGRHDEPALDVDERGEPVYVGYGAPWYGGGWFGGGGGLFTGLMLGSMLGGGWGGGWGGGDHGDGGGGDFGGGDFGGGDFGGGDFGGGDFGGGDF